MGMVVSLHITDTINPADAGFWNWIPTPLQEGKGSGPDSVLAQERQCNLWAAVGLGEHTGGSLLNDVLL